MENQVLVFTSIIDIRHSSFIVNCLDQIEKLPPSKFRHIYVKSHKKLRICLLCRGLIIKEQEAAALHTEKNVVS